MAMVSLGGSPEDKDPVEQGFLQDILSHPQDDGVRLIYADWLEDHGDPARAEFIRCQLELEKLRKLLRETPTEGTLFGFPVHVTPSGWMEKQMELERREQILLTKDIPPYPYTNLFLWLSCPDFTGSFRDGEPNPGFGWTLPGPLTYDNPLRMGQCPKCFVKFRRGFVEEITLPCLAFMENAKSIFSHFPIQKVTWEDAKPFASSLSEENAPPHEIPAWFCWEPKERSREDWDDIPEEIWNLLEKGDEREITWYWYHNQAQDSPVMGEDLSQACVRWGRSQAGLEAL